MTCARNRTSANAKGRLAVQAAVFDSLEARRMLSGVQPGEVTTVPYRGQEMRAVAGEWVVVLQRPEVAIDDDDGDGVALRRIENTSRVPTPAVGAVLDSLALRGVTFDRYIGVEHLFVIRAPVGADHAALDAELSRIPGYIDIVPNFVGTRRKSPDDPEFYKQYGLHNTGQVYKTGVPAGTSDADIDAPEAWDLNTGSSSIVVAVIDSGVNYDHQDLAPNMWVNTTEENGTTGVDDDQNGRTDDIYGYDFADGDSNPDDVDGHGTWVAGVTGGRADDTDETSYNGSGVAWSTRIMALRDGAGDNTAVADTIEAIEYAITMKNLGVNIRVATICTGFPQSEINALLTSFEEAIEDAGEAGILVFAAAGNDGFDIDDPNNEKSYPESFDLDNIITVAASTSADTPWTLTSYGATSVDLFAPGVDILVPLHSNNTGTTYQSGTSFAAPMVAGVAALAFSMKPDLTYGQVRDAILGKVDVKAAFSDLAATEGRLNAYATLDYIKTQYRNLWKRVAIGDEGGVKRTDYFNVRAVPGDPTKTEVRHSYDGVNWTRYGTTTENQETYEIAIFPLAGSDHVTVDSGVNNRIYVNGGDQADEVLTNAAADKIYGGPGNDTLDGNSGDDVIYGQGGDDTIYGQGGADYLDGGTFDDWISGSGGNDSIYARDGNDTLYAGTGSDSVYGGAGNDVFHTSGDGAYVDRGSGEEGTDNILDIDAADVITQD